MLRCAVSLRWLCALTAGILKICLTLELKKNLMIKLFARVMADNVELFIKKSGLSPLFAYTFSDEINFLFMELPFKGRIEKMDSIITSFLGNAFTINLQLEKPVAFDSRIAVLQKKEILVYSHC